MKQILFIGLLIITSLAKAQNSSPKPMAFYGVAYDTAHHKRDSIFRVDSTHLAIKISLASAFNSGMAGLVKPVNNGSGTIYSNTYISRHVTPGVAYSLGFEYVSKLFHNHIFFSLGLEAIKFNCSGSIYQSTVAPYYPDTTAYNIEVLTLDVPCHLYYRITESPKFRLSAGAGVSVGFFAAQLSTADGIGDFNLTDPVNLGTLSLRFDVALSCRTWIALEPYYSIQMYDPVTHIEMAGLKVELL